MSIDYAGFALPKQSSSLSKHSDALTPAEFRKRVWVRDAGRDRCTGEPLSNTADSWDTLGDVCHLKGRRVMPEWVTDPARAILLSRTNHILSDHRGGYRLKLTDPETGEPATDATKKIKFTLYASDQKTVLWTRIR
jgi:hypothetical protein